MKVLLVNVDTGIGGSTGRITEDIYKYIIKNNEKAAVAYGRGCGNDHSIETYRIDTKFEIYTHFAVSRILGFEGYGSIIGTKKLIKFIKEYNPDIIHIHNIHGYYLNEKMFLSFLASYNKPVVWTFHDCWPFTGHCTYFDRYNCEKWKVQCYKCPQKKEYPKSWFFDLSSVNYSWKKQLINQIKNLTLVTPSKWLAGLISDSFLSDKEVQTIYNGIDIDVFSNRKTNIFGDYKNKTVILGIASIWDKRKGLEDFLKLSELLGDKYQFVIVGALQDKFLLDRMKEKGFVYIPRTENVNQLAEIYSSADVYLNLTYEDNFPTTNLEALACGTPVITYDTGGSAESIDRNCGVKVCCGDIEAVKNAIFNISQFSEINCRTRALQFEKELAYSRYYELYKRILNM